MLSETGLHLARTINLRAIIDYHTASRKSRCSQESQLLLPQYLGQRTPPATTPLTASESPQQNSLDPSGEISTSLRLRSGLFNRFRSRSPQPGPESNGDAIESPLTDAVPSQQHLSVVKSVQDPSLVMSSPNVSFNPRALESRNRKQHGRIHAQPRQRWNCSRTRSNVPGGRQWSTGSSWLWRSPKKQELPSRLYRL
ncbi:hypothetical protein FKP32DRAFT_1091383 [Trametes sanguinea]|nr:hypothetical protein FKP32DRAFT_1091383 [Trametes sanguinea]